MRVFWIKNNIHINKLLQTSRLHVIVQINSVIVQINSFIAQIN